MEEASAHFQQWPCRTSLIAKLGVHAAGRVECLLHRVAQATASRAIDFPTQHRPGCSSPLFLRATQPEQAPHPIEQPFRGNRLAQVVYGSSLQTLDPLFVTTSEALEV